MSASRRALASWPVVRKPCLGGVGLSPPQGPRTQWLVRPFVPAAATPYLLSQASFVRPSLPATEYSAPGALRVAWKASSVSPRMAA